MVIVEKSKESIFKRHAILFLAILIIVILILLFSFARVPEKSISDLQKENSGKFKITGFVSNISEKVTNVTQFKISDETGSINATIFEQIDINNGNIVEGTCELNIWNNTKRCNLYNFEIKIEKEN